MCAVRGNLCRGPTEGDEIAAHAMQEFEVVRLAVRLKLYTVCGVKEVVHKHVAVKETAAAALGYVNCCGVS